ncbi:MAG: hypothetical protein V7609_405 [Verrucomicrobiota bacterium]
MKTKYLLLLGLIGIAILGVCCKSSDQASTTTNLKRVSAADKAAIKELFKGADPSTYRLEFDGGRDTMGTKKLTLADVQQLQKTSDPSARVGYVEFISRDCGVLYIWRATINRKVLEGQLGLERVARLDRIIAKYQ